MTPTGDDIKKIDWNDVTGMQIIPRTDASGSSYFIWVATVYGWHDAGKSTTFLEAVRDAGNATESRRLVPENAKLALVIEEKTS